MVRSAKHLFYTVKPEASSAWETNYVCVDNVRFWSMLAIIAVHSSIAWDVPNGERSAQNLQIILVQAFKFGTIGFYFISGFLLGKRLVDHGSARSYFLRRLKRVGVPWALWASLFTLVPFTKRIMFSPILESGVSAFARQLWHRALDVLFFSPYWFVPNFLFALAFLLLCRRYWDDWRFGAVLLGLSLWYGVNVYQHWVPAHHTTALGGFWFYLWLGHWASRHERTVFHFLEKINDLELTVAIFAVGSLALAETCFLRKHDSGNIMNTLRISNQVFSLLVVARLMKFHRVTWPRFIDVRASTFGLFLIHPALGIVLCRLVDFMHPSPLGMGAWAHLGLWTAMFVASYGGSLVLTQALVKRPQLAWMVGQCACQREMSDTWASPRPEVWGIYQQKDKHPKSSACEPKSQE